MRIDRLFFAALITAPVLLSPASRAAAAENPSPAGKTIAYDQDKNGQPDYWRTFDSRGVKILEARDTNGDGKPDYWTHPLHALQILTERDRNFDGRVDERRTSDFIYDRSVKFNRNVDTTREADDDFDGKIDVYRGPSITDKPAANRIGQAMDPTPWNETKEAAWALEHPALAEPASKEKGKN